VVYKFVKLVFFQF